MRYIVVRGAAWPVLLSPCNTPSMPSVYVTSIQNRVLHRTTPVVCSWYDHSHRCHSEFITDVRVHGHVGGEISEVLHRESSKRLALPRNTNDRKHLQSTQTTVNRNNAQPKHQALSKGQPGRRIKPISKAAVHAFSTATTRHHHPHPRGSSPDPFSQHSLLGSTGGLSRTTPQTPPA